MLRRVQFKQRDKEAIILDAVELLREAWNQQRHCGRSREESAGDRIGLTPSSRVQLRPSGNPERRRVDQAKRIHRQIG